ncbi:phage tail tape measure protein [Streptomyces fagopyri]
MALTVGELNGLITIDDRAVNPALRRAEQALRRAGSSMGNDAERAGAQAGQQLGGGFVRGADGQWRDMRANLVDAVTAATLEAESQARRGGQRIASGVDTGLHGLRTDAARAGQQAGDALGDGLADGASDGADHAVSEAGGKLGKLKEVAGGAALAAGAAAGAILTEALGQAMEQGKITARLGAQLGQTPAQAQRYGKIAGQLYAGAVTEDFQSAADTISNVMGSGLINPGATNSQIQSVSTKVADLANTFDQDLGGVTNAVSQLMRTGLAKNADEAFDIVAKGFSTSANKADDFLDTLNEYSTQFKRVGLSGKVAVGLIDQAIKGGARDSDQVADALGQFGELAIGGSSSVKDAFKSIGLSADTVAGKLKKGGKSGQQALQMTLDALRGTKDETTKLNAATALFGDPGTVMGDALFAMNPASAAASSGMDKAAGSATKLGDSVRNNAATQIEIFKRRAMQGLVDFLGGKVIPGLLQAKSVVNRVFGHLWDDAGKGGQQGLDRVVGFVELLGKKLADKAIEQAPKLIAGLAGLGQKAAEYVMSNPMEIFKIVAIAGALITAIANLPALVGAALTVAAYAMVIGFVSKLVGALTENAPKWWASFTGWVSAKAGEAGAVMSVLGIAIGGWFSSLWSTYIGGPVSRAWGSFIGTVSSLPGRATGALSSLGSALAARASSAWSSFQSATAAKASAVLAYIKGYPGRIVSRLGNLSSLLMEKGRNLVQGLWVGIQGMGGWIRSKLIGWAKSMIPGPIAKALGINSPSKVTAAQGRWIARGLIEGLTGSSKQVKSAATKLADIIQDGLKPGRKRSRALGVMSSGSKKLLKLATQEEKLAARMKTASKKLADQMKARDTLAADVKKGVLDDANITKQQTDGWPQTAETILAGLKQDTAASQLFAKNLAALRKKGVRADLIAQIAQAGVAQGSSAASALANANSSQVKQINSQQAALVKAAGQAGTTAGDAMYGAGIHAAQGLVKGLQSQQKAIERQMLAIAKGMSKSIRAALGIKSPSKVMALVGQYTAQGLIQGVEGQRSAVNSSMRSLVDTPASGSWDMASARARAAAAQRVVVEFRGDGRKDTDYILGRVRTSIRKVSGGDVDQALAGRRTG